MDIGVFQSFVQLLQQTNPPPRIEDLRNLWERQCLPRLISLGELLEREVAGDVRKVIDDVAQWQRNLQEALDDERSATTGIYDLLRTFGDRCTKHLVWADSELHKAASDSCRLSDGLMVLMMEGKRDNKE